MNKYLEHLKEDQSIYYIYQHDLSIYGQPLDNYSYIVIVNKDYQVPEEFKDCVKGNKNDLYYEGDRFIFYEMQEWFQKVLNCDVLAWECSCLNKKYIIKEHVKLMIDVDLLKLRKNFDAMLDPYLLHVMYEINNDRPNTACDKLFELLKTIIFTNQIIENHKIVNYNIIDKHYKLFNSGRTYEEIMLVFLELFTPELEILKKKTDELLIKDKLSKYEKV